MRKLVGLHLAVVGALALACPSLAAADVTAPAAVETDPVSHSGDAADDPAIWVNPSDPSRSLVIGTDKLGALEVYDLAGRRVQRWTGTSPNNVDIRGNLVATGDDDNSRMYFYEVDPAIQRLRYIGALDADVTEHGICMYRSRTSGRLYAYVTSYSGRMEQWEVWQGAGGAIGGRRVRGPWWVGGAWWPLIEGCVADDATGWLYVGEEADGIWRYGAEPYASTSARTLVDDASGPLYADVEGLALANGRLIASSQGDDSYVSYRTSDHAYLGKSRVASGASADGCSGTDGIDASSAYLGPSFPQGMFVCQDNSNNAPGSSGNQNFKYVRLERFGP